MKNKLAKILYYAVSLSILGWAIYLLFIKPVIIFYEKGVVAMSAYITIILIVLAVYKLYVWADKKMDEMEDNDGSTA
jgi:hypothetical protein